MRKLTLLLSMLVLCCTLAFAQTRTVTGQVTDESGNPVPFASITVKSTNKGVSADQNGNYSIAAQTGDVLVFSSQGRATREITVGTTNVIAASLQPGTSVNLSEVIVSTGY